MLKYCVKTGKHVHPKRDKAVAHLKSIRRHNPSYAGKVYACKFCKGFHIGRPKRPTRKKESKKRRFESDDE